MDNFMFGYRVPAPDQAMLISGGRQKVEGASFRVVIGHGAWVPPIFRKVRYIGLGLHKVEIKESCRSNEGILLNLEAVAAFKVQADVNSVNAAAQRFLGEQRAGDMEDMTSRIFAGHLRSIVGSMALLVIHADRDALAQAIMEHSQVEMSRLGLTVDSLQIEHLDDGNSGYLDNLARPHLASAKRDADIATAKAEQLAAAAVQEAARLTADQLRLTSIKKSEYAAEMDRAQAIAEQAGPLAGAEAQKAVITAQSEQAALQAQLREQQLVAEVVRPAEAEAKKMRIIAGGAADQAVEQARQMQVTTRAETDRDIVRAEANARQAKVEADGTAYAAEVTGAANAKVVQMSGEASAARIRATKLADAEGELAKAKAMAANDRAQLEAAKIAAMPEVAKALASGLVGSNLTVLNGAEGLTDIMASLLQQGRMIFDSFTQTIRTAGDDTATAPASVDTVEPTQDDGGQV
jgi:flotillin